MNPLKWKREHQVALFVAAGVGAFLGVLYGFHQFPQESYEYWNEICGGGAGSGDCDYLLRYWAIVGVSGLLGAVAAAALVYVRQLLKA